MAEKETKAERFKRVGTFRLNRALRNIEAFGRCGNRATNEYTDEQLDKAFELLEGQVRLARSQFRRSDDPVPEKRAKAPLVEL